jgi:hypothetical protein
LAANAAMNLGMWDKLDKYVSKTEEHPDKNFWMAAININKGKFEEAR